MSDKWLPVDHNILKEKAVLTDIHIHLPTGEIVKDRFDDSLISSYNPGGLSVYDSTVARVLALRDMSFGMTKMVLQPRTSRIEFLLKAHDPMNPEYELFYQNSRASWIQPRRLQLNPGECLIRADGNAIAVTGDKSLLNQEERIRFCLGVLQGAPVQLRTTLDGDKLTINMTSMEEKGIGCLFKKYDEIEQLLQGLFDFFSKLSPTDWARWRTATYFYLQGLSAPALEIQFITLCTFLEIIDASKTLVKETVASLLGITLDEADLLCRIRHRLVHQGQELGEALIGAEHEIASFKTPVDNSIFPVNRSDVQRTGINFFFRFATLLNKLWATKANFKGQCNDYSGYFT